MAQFDEVEYLDELTKPIFELMEKANAQALAVISRRINNIGKLSPTDANSLSVLYRRADLVEIEKILADATKRSLKELDALIEQSAQTNDDLAKELYKAKNTVQELTPALQSIIKTGQASIVDNVLNLSKTKGFMIDGRMTSIAKAYNDSVNLAIYNVQSGLTEYNTAMRSTIRNLTDSGIRVVEFDSGYTRRLDSSVRMNVMDGVRQMNAAYREQQAEEYGADAVFVSYHALCAPDHIPVQGKQYTKERWLNIAENLERQIGQRNCKHYITYGVKGISENPISEQQRVDAIKNSSGMVKYKDLNGNDAEISKYDFSQRQRAVETNIRKLKDRRNQFEVSGDTDQQKELDTRIKDMTKYYKNMSAQGGLQPRLDRLTVQKP